MFLKSAGVETYAGSLILAMRTHSSETPASTADLPESLVAMREALWHSGGKAAPTVEDQALATNEDTALAGLLAVTDHDENVTAFAVATTAAHGTVQLDVATGAWTYNPAANYNGQDSFALSVTDADGQAAISTITVTVAPVNDAPVWTASPSLGIDENTPGGTDIWTLVANDVDGDQVVYSVTTVNSAFQVSAAGVLSVRDGTLLDFETSSSATVTVRASDGQASTDKVFTIAVRNVNEAPNAPVLIGSSVAIFAEPGVSLSNATIATFALSDPDRTTPTLRLRSGSTSVVRGVGQHASVQDRLQSQTSRRWPLSRVRFSSTAMATA